jgi:hypothetical protein
MSELADIIEAKIEEFDALREVFFDEATRCFLLKENKNSGNLISVTELTGGWYIEWREYRDQSQLSYATLETAFADQIGQTSSVGYGIPDAENTLDVYLIDPERRDVVSPSGEEPFWKVYVRLDATRRFTID